MSFWFFCRTRGKTCSVDSTSSPCFHQRAALLGRGKTGGKAHSTLGNAASAKINISNCDLVSELKDNIWYVSQLLARTIIQILDCIRYSIRYSHERCKLLPHVGLYWHKGSKHRGAGVVQRLIYLSHPYSRHSPRYNPPGNGKNHIHLLTCLRICGYWHHSWVLIINITEACIIFEMSVKSSAE